MIQNFFHPFRGPKYGLQGKVCSDDPHFYQSCDRRFGGKITSNNIFCEFYWCDFFLNLLSPALDSMGITCNGRLDCLNTELDEEGCSSVGQSAKQCNDLCEEENCRDEVFCNGLIYGIYCEKESTGVKGYLDMIRICDGRPDCKDGEDEKVCSVTNTTENVCEHWTGKVVPVHNFTRCHTTDIPEMNSRAFQYCKIRNPKVQQTNCSDDTRGIVQCEVNGYPSNVSKYMLCKNEGKICDDNLENLCLPLSKSCHVHRHLMCDNVDHCSDGADEKDKICGSMTEGNCTRRVGSAGNISLPVAWLLDGWQDCIDGRDETDIWPTCGKGKTFRIVPSQGECENTFICPWGEPGYVELADLCDGVETCGNENAVCSTSRRSGVFQNLETIAHTSNVGLTKRFSYCFPGLQSIENLKQKKCAEESFIFPDDDFFGINDKTSLILPGGKQPCDYFYGEHYVYTSCTDRCLNSSCPLMTVPSYDVCPDQFPDRIGTIANNHYLAFFTKSHKDVYTNRYFVCYDKTKCLDYSRVCDLVNDCGDASDEENCINHFQCQKSGEFKPKTAKCDKVFDCMDMSDECNEECSAQILEGTFLKALSWAIGSLAVLANFGVLFNCFRTLGHCQTSVALINKSFIILISFGDFLIGCYLMIISVYDGIVFKGNYCKQQIHWITSMECSAIGIVSTIGSQVSLFSMTGLSIIRVVGLTNPMRIPGEVTLMKCLALASGAIFIFLASVLIAVLPVLNSFEDFFVNGWKFSDGLRLFIGATGKRDIFSVFEAYYGKMKNNVLSWETTRVLIRGMFSHDEPNDFTNHTKVVGFYGNDGVCLFKYFVKNDDPQRIFVWSILALNFACFLFISLSYVRIGIISRGSSKTLMKSRSNKDLAKRTKRTNRKISIIITTDFLCWIPFIVISLLHSIEVVDATPWYSYISMIILPINSVINPFLYDDSITKVLLGPIRRRKTEISRSTFISKLKSQSKFLVPRNKSAVMAMQNQGEPSDGNGKDFPERE